MALALKRSRKLGDDPTLALKRSRRLGDDPTGEPKGEGVFPQDLMDAIIGCLPWWKVVQLRPELGLNFKNAFFRHEFLRHRPNSEGEFGPFYFTTNNKGDWNWYGFDTKLKKWTRLPWLNFLKKVLPSSDPDHLEEFGVPGQYKILPHNSDPDVLEKLDRADDDYLMMPPSDSKVLKELHPAHGSLVASDGGLLCMDVGKAPSREKLIICNPLTQTLKVLPPLNHARHPLLMHLNVDRSTWHYKIIVAGGDIIDTGEPCLKTEEYDSRTGVWECPDGSNLPSPPFYLVEHQSGVYFKDAENEVLFCAAVVAHDPDGRAIRAVVAYDIENKQWTRSPSWIQIPHVRNQPRNIITTQILGCGQSLLCFSEQEEGWEDAVFLVHTLRNAVGSGSFSLDEVTQRLRGDTIFGVMDGSEVTCVPISESEVCFFNFNTEKHTNMETIKLNNPRQVTRFEAGPKCEERVILSANSMCFVSNLSFRAVVCSAMRCERRQEYYCSDCERRYLAEVVAQLQSLAEILARIRALLQRRRLLEMENLSLEMEKRSLEMEKRSLELENRSHKMWLKGYFIDGIAT